MCAELRRPIFLFFVDLTLVPVSPGLSARYIALTKRSVVATARQAVRLNLLYSSKNSIVFSVEQLYTPLAGVGTHDTAVR